MSDEGGEYELLMPFVTVASKGGPHDDDSYVAGWEMAQLDARLALARHGSLVVPIMTVRRESMPQVALLAMKHGFIEQETGFDGDERWVDVEFRVAGDSV